MCPFAAKTDPHSIKALRGAVDERVVLQNAASATKAAASIPASASASGLGGRFTPGMYPEHLERPKRSMTRSHTPSRRPPRAESGEAASPIARNPAENRVSETKPKGPKEPKEHKARSKPLSRLFSPSERYLIMDSVEHSQKQQGELLGTELSRRQALDLLTNRLGPSNVISSRLSGAEPQKCCRSGGKNSG